MTRIVLLLLGLALAACTPPPRDDGPLTPLPEPHANPLVVPPAQDPDGGAS